MLPSETREKLLHHIAQVENPREMAVDVMFALQQHYGHLSDAAVAEAADMLSMSPLQVEELATFYTFVFREPVGRYVIHVCDSLICWMDGGLSVSRYLSEKLKIAPGETTPDGRFTLLTVCCIGYCDRSPAMLINRKAYGPLTPAKIDDILDKLEP